MPKTRRRARGPPAPQETPEPEAEAAQAGAGRAAGAVATLQAAAGTAARRRTRAASTSRPAATANGDQLQLRAMIVEAVQEALLAAKETSTASGTVTDPADPEEAAPAPPSASSADAANGRERGGTGNPAESVGVGIRQRIADDKYIALNVLLEAGDRDDVTPAFQLINGLLQPMSRSPRVIGTFGAWCTAFLKFASIYLEAHPDAAAGLMSHMRQVCHLTAPGLGLAWREFDETFRKSREVAPDKHPWGETASSSPMWLQAVAKGIGGNNQQQVPQSKPGGTGEATFRTCIAYNSARGCIMRGCRYQHACRVCRGFHPVYRCTSVQRRTRQRPGTATNTLTTNASRP